MHDDAPSPPPEPAGPSAPSAPADARLFFPATARNRGPILDVLRRVLPEAGTVLEVASGSGEHAAFFARALPGLRWLPSDPDPAHGASIDAWRRHEGLPNLLPPLRLDVREHPWPVAHADAVYCANLIHIAPWAACLGLFDGAARVLPAGAPLVLYGPFRVGGAHTAPSNEAFDASLRARDPAWGVRDLEDVTAAAAAAGFRHEATVPMPANNQTVIWRRLAAR
jgi:hypothetical protein